MFCNCPTADREKRMRSSITNRPRFSFFFYRSLSIRTTGAKNGATSFLMRPKLRIINTHRGMKFCGKRRRHHAATRRRAAIAGAAHVREKELLTLVRRLIPFPGEDTEQEGETHGERSCIKSNVASRDNRRTISHLLLCSPFPSTPSLLFRSLCRRSTLYCFSQVIDSCQITSEKLSIT